MQILDVYGRYFLEVFNPERLLVLKAPRHHSQTLLDTPSSTVHHSSTTRLRHSPTPRPAAAGQALDGLYTCMNSVATSPSSSVMVRTRVYPTASYTLIACSTFAYR